MNRHFLFAPLSLLGLAIVTWIGAGYVGTHALGVVVTLVIGACYTAGVLELHRYRQATDTLLRAVADTSAAKDGLSAWLSSLHASLRPRCANASKANASRCPLRP